MGYIRAEQILPLELIELIQQYFLLLRTGDLYDFLSDIIGAIIGVIIFLLIEKVFIKKHTNKN